MSFQDLTQPLRNWMRSMDEVLVNVNTSVSPKNSKVRYAVGRRFCRKPKCTRSACTHPSLEHVLERKPGGAAGRRPDRWTINVLPWTDRRRRTSRLLASHRAERRDSRVYHDRSIAAVDTHAAGRILASVGGAARGGTKKLKYYRCTRVAQIRSSILKYVRTARLYLYVMS